MNSRWLLAALAVSVVVNLLIAGYLAGRWSGGEYRVHMADPTVGYFRIVRHLPEPRRETLRPLLREHYQQHREYVEAVGDSQRALFEALETEPLDVGAVEDHLAQLRDRLNASEADNHAAFVEFARALSADERRQWVAWMTRRDRFRGAHGFPGHLPGPPGGHVPDSEGFQHPGDPQGPGNRWSPRGAPSGADPDPGSGVGPDDLARPR